jgi:hypothetical protein
MYFAAFQFVVLVGVTAWFLFQQGHYPGNVAMGAGCHDPVVGDGIGHAPRWQALGLSFRALALCLVGRCAWMVLPTPIALTLTALLLVAALPAAPLGLKNAVRE